MTTQIIVYLSCRACNGTGIDRHSVSDGAGGVTWIEETCSACSGSGEVPSGTLREGALDDIIDSLNDIKEKVDEIKETVDAL